MLNGNGIIEAIVNSGLALNDALDKFNKAEVSPAIVDLNRMIKVVFFCTKYNCRIIYRSQKIF